MCNHHDSISSFAILVLVILFIGLVAFLWTTGDVDHREWPDDY